MTETSCGRGPIWGNGCLSRPHQPGPQSGRSWRCLARGVAVSLISSFNLNIYVRQAPHVPLHAFPSFCSKQLSLLILSGYSFVFVCVALAISRPRANTHNKNPLYPTLHPGSNMRAFSGLSFLLSLAIPLTALTSVAADTHDALFRRRDHRKRLPDTSSVEKRSFDNARFTYFVDGLGACGQTNAPGDFVSKLCLSYFVLFLTFYLQIVAMNTHVGAYMKALLKSG